MIETVYQKFLECNQLVCTDSRSIIDGSVFFALRGDNFNGNDFALNALKSGASYAIVDEPFDSNPRIIRVEDTLQTLQQLATFHRRKFKIPVIAITGSNGKTTTKELTASVLAKKYKTLYTQGNLNNHIGVPLTLLNLNSNTEIAIIEMGANHRGEIAALCKIAEPGYGLITNIGKAHLEGFGGIEGVIKGKTEMYDYLILNQGVIFCNSENETLLKRCFTYNKLVTYGTTTSGLVSGNMGAWSKNIIVNWKKSATPLLENKIQTNLTGNYNFENVLAAITVGVYFNVPDKQINEAVKSYTPNNQRSQLIVTLKNNTIVADYYNANPTSMEHALKSFSGNFKKGTCVILGDMFELGEDARYEHQRIADLVKSLNFDLVILAGPQFSQCKNLPEAIVFQDSNQAAGYLKQNPITDMNILIKGSRGSRMELLMDAL